MAATFSFTRFLPVSHPLRVAPAIARGKSLLLLSHQRLRHVSHLHLGNSPLQEEFLRWFRYIQTLEDPCSEECLKNCSYGAPHFLSKWYSSLQYVPIMGILNYPTSHRLHPSSPILRQATSAELVSPKGRPKT